MCTLTKQRKTTTTNSLLTKQRKTTTTNSLLTKQRKTTTTVYSPSKKDNEVPEEEPGARAGFPKWHPTLLFDVDLLHQPRGKRHLVETRCTCNNGLSLRHATPAHQPTGRLWHQPRGRWGGGGGGREKHRL